VERRAQSSLGLLRTEPFYVIARLRILNDEPRVIERVFLNPAHFPIDFLSEHDFGTESLIHAYLSCGFDPILRETEVRARLAHDEEQRLLNMRAEPILEAEQEMRAIRSDVATPVVFEFLHAVYRDWTFRMVDRRPGRHPEDSAQTA
jgi:DNA-binding GntR family transcriptional regulator